MIIMVCFFKDPKKEIKMVRTQILKGVKCKFKWKGIFIKISDSKICTLPFKMFCPFWSVWCKMAQAEVGVSLP